MIESFFVMSDTLLPPIYQHTQYARWTWAPLLLGVGLGLFGTVYCKAGNASIAVALGLLALLALVSLFIYGLTVTLDGNKKRLSARFGLGLYTKHIALDDVVSCEKVRNTFWMGWGIRWFPGGWLYNVDGLDAVELTLKNASRIRIGTDDPDPLCDVIDSVISS